MTKKYQRIVNDIRDLIGTRYNRIQPVVCYKTDYNDFCLGIVIESVGFMYIKHFIEGWWQVDLCTEDDETLLSAKDFKTDKAMLNNVAELFDRYG